MRIPAHKKTRPLQHIFSHCWFSNGYVWHITNIIMKKRFSSPLFFMAWLLLLANLSATAQTPISKQRMLFDLGYSFHGGGDFEGAALGFGLQQAVKKRFSLQYQMQFTVHSGSEFGYVRNEGDVFTQSVPMYSVIAGIQIGVLPTWHVFGREEQWLNVIAGPLVRFQINGSPDWYTYHNNQGTNRPDYYVIKANQPKVWTAGYFVALESHFVHRPKWTLGIRGQLQNDTNADMIAGFGLVFHRKLFGCAAHKNN